MKKRVAIIIPGGIGGGYFMQGVPVLEDYINRISELFDVTVFSMIKADPSYSPKNFKLHCTNASYSSSAIVKILLTTVLFINENRKYNYQLIHGIWGFPSGFLAVVLGKILRIPSLVSLQGVEAANLPEINYGHMRSFAKRKIILWTFKHATGLTALTNFQITELSHYGFARKNSSILPYGADVKLFTINKKELVPPFNFIHIGNLTRVKDQHTLLKTFKIITEKTDNCFLRIIGDGECLSELKTLAKTLTIDDKVEFIGAIPHKNIPEQLHWAHILLHTSLSEGQSVVVAEAAASGVVVCGTRVGQIADWAEDKCLSADCGDYRTLANKVLELLNNTQKYNNLRDSAYEWALKHTPANLVGSFQKLYNQLIL